MISQQVLFKKSFYKQLATYMSGALFIKGSNLLFLPLLVRLISPAEYGLLELLTNLQVMFGTITSFGLLETSHITFFRTVSRDEQRSMIGTIMLTYFILGIPILFLSGLFSPLVNTYLLHNQASLSALIGLLFICIFNFYSELTHNLLSYRGYALISTFLQIFSYFLTFVLTLFFVIILRKSVTGIIYAQCIGNGIGTLLKLYVLQTKYHPIYIYSWKHLSTTIPHKLYLGFSFLWNTTATTMLNNIDLFILTYYTSFKVVGIYALANKCGVAFQQLITTPFFMVYTPKLYLAFQQAPTLAPQTESRNQKNMILFICFFISITSGGYFLLNPFAKSLLPSQFHSAIPLAYFIVIGKIFIAGARFNSQFILYSKHVYTYSMLLISANVINCISNFIVVQRYGALGCSLTTMSAALYLLLTTRWYNQYLHQSPLISTKKEGDKPAKYLHPINTNIHNAQ